MSPCLEFKTTQTTVFTVKYKLFRCENDAIHQLGFIEFVWPKFDRQQMLSVSLIFLFCQLSESNSIKR